MAQGYSVKEFQSYLKEQVEKICSDENLKYDNEKQRSRAFNLWIARLYKENNRYIDTDPEDALLGERSDLKIDLFLEDTNDNVIYLIQSEFTGTSKKSKSANVEEAKVSEFFNNHDNLMDRAWVRKYGNKRAVSYLSDYKKLIEDDFRFKYIFISTASASDRVKEVVQKANRKYEKKNINIECMLYDFSDFKDLVSQAESVEAKIPDFVEFYVPKDQMFIKENPKLTVVTALKANAIEDLLRQHKDSLFAYNIRTYLGEKGINKDIVATAEEEPENFFYYNNGISAVCTDLDIKKNKIIAKKFQIINGAQTVGALKAIEDNPNLEILMRITETQSVGTEKGINEKIIRYNNTQNKITLSDFRSNDKIQLDLLNKFKTLNFKILGKINYIRKRGDKMLRKGTYNLKLEDLAKIRYSYLCEPCTPISKAKDLWKVGDNGLYKKSFGISNVIEDIISDNQFLNTFLTPVVFYEDILERCKKEAEKKDENRFLKRFRYHFLYFYGLIKKEAESQGIKPASKKLVNDKEYLSNFTDPIFARIVERIVDLFYDEVEKDKYQNAPIRDLTMSSKHLQKLENKIMSRLPKLNI